MCKVQMLRALVKQRINAAAEEIFGLFERTIAEYEEELSRSKEENERQQKLLDAVFNPQLQLHRADVQQLLVVKEDVLPEQQEWSSSLDQEDPEPPHIKEEQEKLWTSQEGEQLQGLEEADIKFPFSPVSVKSEDDEEEPQSSQLHERQTEQMETEADGEDCGGPEPARNSDPERHPEPDTVDKTGDSSEPETENSDDWNETREPQSSSSSLNNVEVLVGDWRFVALEKRFCCSQCGKRFWTRGHLRRHIRSHTGEKPFSCSVCKKSFARKGHVPLHMRLHTGEKPFSCSVCDKRFTWSNQVKLHKCVGHQSSQLHQTQTEENRDAEPPASSSTKQIETEADGEDCGGLEPARNSVPDRHPEPDTVDKTGDSSEPETDNSDDWKETREPQSGLSSLNNDKIPVSDSRCSTDRNFIIIDDDDEVPVSDSRCSAGEKPFNCSECDKRFDIKIALTSHMRYHKLERNFSCSVCEKSFARIGSLEKHMRIHNGEKPFSCTICDKVFTECGNLKRHLRCHTGERPFSCSVCNKTYAQRRSLLLHTRSHTGEKPFSCSVCEKSFVSNAHLKNHMKTHTGEKPFSCSVCGKRFSEKSSITHHMVVHTREKRFSCSVCNRRFAWRRQIKSHKCVGHQSQTEENREAEPPASSSTEHMITQNLFINDIITDLSSLVTSSVTSPHFV